MNESIIYKKWFLPLILFLLWVIIFFDVEEFGIVHSAIEAASKVGCFGASFYIGKYYFPKIKNNRRYKYQFLLLCLLVVLISFTEDILFDDDLDQLRDSSYNFWMFFEFIFAVITVIVPLVFSWAYVITEKSKEDQLAISRLETLNNEAALNALKNQINPHFLFNALSNIYSTAYLGDKQTPDRIMQLSKMLRYVIYDCDKDMVNIGKEIAYIRDYVDFQRFKIKKEQDIDLDILCEDDIQIAPMVLLPFIENAFKHSNIGITKDAWVKILLKTEGETLVFCVENSLKNSQELVNKLEQKEGGIGLENIKKRLNLVYGGCHKLSIENVETFRVELRLKANLCN